MGTYNSRRAVLSRALRDTTAILIQLQSLVTEIVFTIAAFYGLVHALNMLTK